MAIQRTFSIIKPDAVKKNVVGKILSRFEDNGLRILAAQMILSVDEAKRFYEVHKDRPFYGELVSYMTSGPVLVSVLEGEDAVNLNRKLMGATDPAKAGKKKEQFALILPIRLALMRFTVLMVAGKCSGWMDYFSYFEVILYVAVGGGARVICSSI